MVRRGCSGGAIGEHRRGGGDPACKQKRAYDRQLYKQRNRIERCFNKLKHFRRFATRYCKTFQTFRSFTALACAWLRLKLYVDTPKFNFTCCELRQLRGPILQPML